MHFQGQTALAKTYISERIALNGYKRCRNNNILYYLSLQQDDSQDRVPKLEDSRNIL